VAKVTGSKGSIGSPETKGKPKPTTPIPAGKANRGGGDVNSSPTMPGNPGGGWGHK
jgi:hypothetical protein